MAGLAVLISSRKIVPLVGELELAQFFADGPGECTGRMAEQFALQQRFRERSAGDFDERFIAAAAAAMDRSGDQRLAGAAFAGDKHRSFRVGHGIDHMSKIFNMRVVVPDDIFHAEAEIELGLQSFVFFDDLLLVERPA